MLDDMSGGFLVSSLIIGVVGFALIIYGKKAERFTWIIGGLLMSVFPYFVHSLLAMWAVAGLCMGGTYAASRYT